MLRNSLPANHPFLQLIHYEIVESRDSLFQNLEQNQSLILRRTDSKFLDANSIVKLEVCFENREFNLLEISRRVCSSDPKQRKQLVL